MIQDPAGLLQRIPELQALCEDARIRRAVEGGDPFKVYRALQWTRLTGRLRSQREVLDALLARRRLFARPLKGTPWLGTMNGFGASFLGSAEQDARDGTSIATHSIVALFAVPLLPLGAYVVRKAEGGGPLSSAWSIFARVPMGALPWLYSRAVALGAVVLVGVGALSALHDARTQDVHLVNGFTQELEVTLAGQTKRVPAGEVRVLNVPTGVQQGRARTLAGVEVDALQLTVRSDVDVLGWNIAGAAPVFQDVVVYSSESAKSEREAHEPGAIYCGQRTFEVESAQDIFTKPPETVSMKKSQREVRRTYVDLARSDTPAMQMCLGFLSAKNRRGEAMPFVEAQARLDGWSDEATGRALQVASALGDAEALRVAQQALAARPQDVSAHRIYQAMAERAGKLEALRTEYRARAEAAPDSASAQYLHARLLDPAQLGPAMEALVKRFPEDAVILRSALYSRTERGDWAAVTQAWERLNTLDAAQASEQLESHVRALVALGRGDEALALLQRTFEAQQGPARAPTAELYARVAHALEGRPGAPAPDALLAKLEAEEGGESLWMLRLRAGLKVEGAPQSALLKLSQLIGKDPDAALGMALEVSQAEVPVLDKGTWALAYAEALRTANAPVLERLKDPGYVSRRTFPDFERFVRGEAVGLERLDVDPELRAAACLVRARNGSLPREERERLREQARRDDVLHGRVSEAVAAWSL